MNLAVHGLEGDIREATLSTRMYGKCDFVMANPPFKMKDIEAVDWSLTPGRYVGVAPAEVDDDFDFEQSLKDIHVELADLNDETVALAAMIQRNSEGLGK